MNLFDLYVTIGAKDEASGAVSKIGAATVAVGHLMADAAKTAGKAIVNLGKQAIGGFSDYEQLVGGVETLFTSSKTGAEAFAESISGSVDAIKEFQKANGLAVDGILGPQTMAAIEAQYGQMQEMSTKAVDMVMENAANAYKTAGLSANEYMETVTSFSASLLQSLSGDTEEAARMADQAIVDMADNANKMGTDMSMIQNAYQGFAKQNYTMLDNLKLGYGGTQQEMYRLMQDAEKLGAKFNSEFYLTEKGQLIADFADITTAIHAIQTDMGITGTTAKEASETIGGSVASMKSAWQNLVVGFADGNADIGILFSAFTDSLETVADNVFPVVENVLTNVFDTLSDKAPEMLKIAVDLFMKIAKGALQAIPGIIESIPEIIDAITDGFVEAWPEIVEIGKDIVRGLWEGIQALAGWLGDKVSGFFNGIVGNVKGLLGIHSPSRVFASIGRNMALGVGDGWESEYPSVRNGISSGLDFGTSRVGFAESGLGVASAGMVNGIASAGNAPVQLTAKFYWSDGREMSSLMLGDLIQVAKANGTPIVNPG